jgi:hypothetical protein
MKPEESILRDDRKVMVTQVNEELIRIEEISPASPTTRYVALSLNRGLCGCRGIYITYIVDSNQGVARKSRTKVSDAEGKRCSHYRRI